MPPRTERRSAVNLDRYWDAVVRDLPLPAPDDHTRTVRRLIAHDHGLGPDRAFVEALENRLMTTQTSTANHSESAFVLAALSRSRPLRTLHSSRQRFGVMDLVGTVLLAGVLVVLLFAGWRQLQPTQPNPTEPVTAPNASVATSSPVASTLLPEQQGAVCDIAPRTSAPEQKSEAPPDLVPGAIEQNGRRVYTDATLIPHGARVDPSVRKLIDITLREFAICELAALAAGDAGDSTANNLIRQRQFSLFTNQYLRRHAPTQAQIDEYAGVDSAEWWFPYWDSAIWIPGMSAGISDSWALGTDRAGAIVIDPNQTAIFVVFRLENGWWKVDEVALVPDIYTPGNGQPSPPTAPDPTADVTLELRDILFSDPDLQLPAGVPIRFTVRNAGAAMHSLVVDELGINIVLESGTEQTFTITIPEGQYMMYCSIPGHREAGMVGTITANPAEEN